MKNRGFTLIEMLVSLGIFSVLLTATMSAFVRGFAYQKRIVEMQAVQREGSYLMETLSREIRMATGILASQSGNSDHSVNFFNHDGANTAFCQATLAGVCNGAGEYFAVKNFTAGTADIINSADIKVSSARFYVNNFGSSTTMQPLITIVMKLQSRKDPTVNFTLQSTVAMRLY